LLVAIRIYKSRPAQGAAPGDKLNIRPAQEGTPTGL